MSLRHVYGLGPAIVPAPAPATPLWLATEQARRAYQAVTIAYSNQEATEEQLLAAARRLRSLQSRWTQS